tara:strand:+ start:219 stop:434 length:216 start_codon:yes stop_codon:yes gene_type:complete
MTQKIKVLNHLKKRNITTFQAFSLYQITCLAERIRDLKEDGHKITMEWGKSGDKRFAIYHLVKTAPTKKPQ